MRSIGAPAAVMAVAVFLFPGFAPAAMLGTPSLSPGQDIKVENGEVLVMGQSITVVRYTWRDAATFPRSVSLVPAGPTTAGYAVQMTYTIAGGAPIVLNTDPLAGDGGFGYFVSHELFRSFADTIASKHLEDDSPLGRYLASTGTAQSVGTQQAVHEYRLTYPRWGTTAPMADPDGATPADPSAHTKYALPVVIRWSFVAGSNYPLWSVDFDLTGTAQHIANDVRGPYGVMYFNEGVGPAVTALRWGDMNVFAADAGAGNDFSSAAMAGTLGWSWSAANTGRRYNAMSSGNYEFGFVDTVSAAASKYADGYSPSRYFTKASAPACFDGDIFNSLPCAYEWSYQSFQYDYGPPARPKIAWGSSPYLGTGLSQVYVSDSNPNFEALNGTGRISYGVHIVAGKAGAGAPLTLGRASAAMEANPTLTIPALSGGGIAYTVLGDAGGPYNATRSLAPWNSVRLVATPSGGFTFGAWTGACAGVAGNACMIAMDQSRSVGATFNAVAGGSVVASPALLDFGAQSVATAGPVQTVTITNNTASTVTVNSVSVPADFIIGHNCVTLGVGASCSADVRFKPQNFGGALNSAAPVSGSLVVNTTAGALSVPLSGSAERSFVTHYYQSILGRTPDAGGKNFWMLESTRVQQLGADINEVWYALAISFFGSGEYSLRARDDAGYVTDLYRTFLAREPDGAGLAFWLSNLNQGMPRDVLLTQFTFSPEFIALAQSVFGNTGATRAEVYAVMDFYRGLLGRLPDSGGFTFWVQQFHAAQCTGNVAQIYAQVETISSLFANGPEIIALNRNNGQYVGALYNAFLRRGGDLPGVLFWVNQLDTGAMTRDQVRVQFRNSPEFNVRANAIVAQGC